MSGGKNKQPRSYGYTIVEVLIFLAISGFMFTVAAIAINGKQANAEFVQGMNDVNSQIRTTINDVANGYYPSTQDFSCTVAGAAAPTFTHVSSGTPPESGSNADCIFMGKVMQFGVAGSNGTAYNIYSVSGRRFAPNSSEAPLSFSEAKPKAADNGTSGDVNLTVFNKLQWGLRLTAMYKVTYSSGSSSTAPIGSVGFFGNFGNVSGGVLQSGAQSVIVADVPGALNQNRDTTIANISSIASPATSNTSVLLCFDNSRGRKGSISIGGQNGQQLQTEVKMAGVGAPC